MSTDAPLRDSLRMPEPIGVQHLQLGAVAVLAVTGELDIARCPRLGVAINEALRTRPSALVVDLCGVTFADSTALALLLNARRRTQQQRIPLRLACNVPSTLQLLELTRLDRDFEVYPSRQAALKASVSR